MKCDPNLATVVSDGLTTDVRHDTHLTVHWRCSIKGNQVENYGQKRRHAGKRVNLIIQVKISARLWNAQWQNPKKGNRPILSIGRGDDLG